MAMLFLSESLGVYFWEGYFRNFTVIHHEFLCSPVVVTSEHSLLTMFHVSSQA